MGKAEKLKEQRKIEKLRKEINKEKKIKLTIIKIIGIIFFAGLGFGVYKGAFFIKDKYFTKEIEENMEITEIKTYKTGDRTYSQIPDMQIDTNKTYIAKFETSMGNFDIELFDNDAPKTVNNFIALAVDKFYDGLTFHRVINDFMIQGGDPLGTGAGDPGYKFEDEINDHKLVKGVLAMANSGEDTNGSQFFVVTKEATDWLDGKHTAFGNVTSGLDVVMNISAVAVDDNDKPTTDVVINKITIEER
jgi:cyclophilin family peptidyl-prolyl cis-trans isomerase